jgi:hypothetical protein
MKPDRYANLALTVIAFALLAIAFRPEIREARAQSSSFKCTGTLKANAWGGTTETLGGYEVDVSCR